MAAISEGEVAVYDRQLRLWGVQAQQRLLKSKVLVWGLEGSNIEVCKNLVLAGVSLTVRDHRSVSSADVSFNYFLREEDLGRNRAECAAKRLQEMNPLCKVLSSGTSPEGKAELGRALKDYNFVLVGPGVLGWDFELVRCVDAACREASAGFALTVSCGELAFFFSDLGEHEVQERSSAQGGAGAPAPAAEQGAAAAPELVSFPSFEAWLASSPAELQAQKVDASVLFVALAAAFVRAGEGRAAPERGADFEAYCRDVAKCAPEVDGGASLQELYGLLFLEPLVHVASILGGLLAQEVIKALTKRDAPLANCVCFNAHTGAALVERIPAPAKAAKKRKVEEVADLLD